VKEFLKLVNNAAIEVMKLGSLLFVSAPMHSVCRTGHSKYVTMILLTKLWKCFLKIKELLSVTFSIIERLVGQISSASPNFTSEPIEMLSDHFISNLLLNVPVKYFHETWWLLFWTTRHMYKSFTILEPRSSLHVCAQNVLTVWRCAWYRLDSMWFEYGETFVHVPGGPKTEATKFHEIISLAYSAVNLR